MSEPLSAQITILHTTTFVLLLLGCFAMGAAVAMFYAHVRTYKAALKLLEMVEILSVAREEAEALRREWQHRSENG